jgi:hypothetical protein
VLLMRVKFKIEKDKKPYSFFKRDTDRGNSNSSSVVAVIQKEEPFSNHVNAFKQEVLNLSPSFSVSIYADYIAVHHKVSL